MKLFLLFVLAGGTATGQKEPEHYLVYKTPETIKIDGKANEAAWKQAAWTHDFIDIEGTVVPKYKTHAKMLWDDNNLYFYAELEEPQVWATLKQRDTVIFYNNDFEIFIDPDGDTHNYMEFEMNALNTVWDLFLTKPYRNHGKVVDNWDIKGLKTAVHINGTLNNPNDVDKGWSVEIAMPWSALTEAGAEGKVPVGEFWRLGFSRVNWQYDLIDGKYTRKRDQNGTFLPEYNWVWSPQWVINMHEPERWGYVYFANKEVGQKASFIIPEDEHIKWFLYEKYRELLGRKNRKDYVIGSKKILGKEIMPQYDAYPFGWSISVISPFTHKTLSINEDGKFKSYATGK